FPPIPSLLGRTETFPWRFRYGCVTKSADMFSLQKLFGKDDPFFQLLEESAKESQNSVQALKRILQNPSMTPTLDEFIAARRKEKELATEIRNLLVNTFVTALER